MALAPDLYFRVTFVRFLATKPGRWLGRYPVCSTREDEVVTVGEGLHKCLGDVRFIESEGQVTDLLDAVREFRELAWSWLIKLVDMCRDEVGVIDLGESDSKVGVIILVVGVTVHVEELGILPRQPRVGNHQSLVVLRRGFRIRDVIHVAWIRAGIPFKGWRKTKL